MASSSLLFGGLSLWHARRGGSGSEEADLSVLSGMTSQVQQVVQWHNVLLLQVAGFLQCIDRGTVAWLASTLCLLVLVAYSSNPGDASFRSYLTELSLHQHLHQLRQESPARRASLTDDEVEGATRREAEKGTSPHILTFADRISVSLRTPRYERRDFGIFCTVTVRSSPLLKRGCAANRRADPSSNGNTRYVGAFGKWWDAGLVSTSVSKQDTKGKMANRSHAADSWGVSGMKAGETIEEVEVPNTQERTIEKLSDSSHVHAPKATSNAQAADLSQMSQHAKPAGRRKDKTQKPRPAVLLPSGEVSVLERNLPEELGPGRGSVPTSAMEAAERQSSWDQQSSPVAVTSPAVFDTAINSPTPLSDFQAQLEQVRIASETSKKQLQEQLESLRSRKRDEDAARLDVKGRMKMLDESKRQAEGTKREAERRLKAASGLREAIENRIEAKAQELEDWHRKEAAQQLNVQASSERKATRITEMKAEIDHREKEALAIEDEVEQLNAKLEALQVRLLEEEANLEAAKELAVERESASMAQRAYEATRHHNTYPLLSGPGEMVDSYESELPLTGSDGFVNSTLQPAWAVSNQTYTSYSPNYAPAMQVPMTSNEIRDDADFDTTFDPTIPLPASLEENRPGFAPFSFDQASAFQTHGPMDTPPGFFGEGASLPISPFTSDLLPSNLFQNADDDEKHVGVLPGTRSERVEAALNRFGLDNSDTSDVEAAYTGQEDEASGGEEEEDQEAKEPSAVASGSLRNVARSWWGGRSRNASKDRESGVLGRDIRAPTAMTSTDEAEAETTVEPSKRRSLSIFPKLSLNPGAKSFRGSSKKIDIAEPVVYDEEANSFVGAGTWNSSSGVSSTHPTRQDFESMKRAFQTNNLNASQEEEEQGRRSWSAFDTWQQQQQQQQHTGSPSLSASHRAFRMPSRLNESVAAQNQRSRSDSIARFRMMGKQPDGMRSTDWLDEVFSPLHKTRSVDAQSLASSSSLPPQTQQRAGKPSRFAFWSNHSNSSGSSNGAAGQLNNAYKPAGSLDEAGGGGSNSSTSAPADSGSVNASFSSPASTVPVPSKRSSFRWSRRQDSNADGLTFTEKSKETE